MKRLGYNPRARFCGNVEWLCPFCGTINKHRLAYTGRRQFECRGHNCSRRFHVGLKLWVHTRKGSGGRATPCDAFPIVGMGEWQRRAERAASLSAI